MVLGQQVDVRAVAVHGLSASHAGPTLEAEAVARRGARAGEAALCRRGAVARGRADERRWEAGR